jgi:putative tryptophan/tyrosine transport system substrate-binding protein
MRRRDFIAGFTGLAAVSPLVARAQQAAMPVVGIISSGSPAEYGNFVAAFRQGLKEAGYVEGKNLAIEYRWAEGHYDRLPSLAADLVNRQVAVIAAAADPSALAAKAATATIPIVFFSGTDPVTLGLVASLNQPGGNVTGVSILSSMLLAKQLELLRELVPTAVTISFLVNPDNPNTEARIGSRPRCRAGPPRGHSQCRS